MDDEIAILRHDTLGALTVVKNALSFVLEGHTGQINDKTRQFLKEAYKRNEEAISLLIKTREEKVENG